MVVLHVLPVTETKRLYGAAETLSNSPPHRRQRQAPPTQLQTQFKQNWIFAEVERERQ